jgi:hypothetical protein
MPMRLDLDTLIELYPALDGRRSFLQRAMDILRDDRLALQDALARHAYAQAGELAHRVQGSVAFLTGEPERSAEIVRPLEQAIRQGLPASSRDTQATVLEHLMALESAIGQAISRD